jgi:arylsulfatase A-like enzyme
MKFHHQFTLLAATALLLAACGKEQAPAETASAAAEPAAPAVEAPVAVEPEATEEPRRKNIIFIMADDMGYGDLGSYGQQKIKTPHLDRMAEQGMRFTDFYAGTTVCAPSRSVLMTGLHMGHTPVRGNAGKDIQTLLPQDVTVAEVLKDAGYNTALIGKWGLGDDGNTGLPNDQGFDYFFGYLNQVHAHNHYPGFLWRNKEKVDLENDNIVLGPIAYMDFHGGVTPHENRKQYSSDLFYEETLEYLDKAGDKPFFLFLALTSPHANNEAEKFDWAHGMEVPDYGPYADLEGWREEAKGYAGMVHHIDEGVGSILAKLEETGLADDTIVMFTSDNGPHEEGGNDPYFFDSSGPHRGTKRALTDGGIRVPFIAWGPGTVPAGTESDHVGYFGDLMAFATDVAGVETPEGLDSLSFLPVTTGNAEEQEEHEFVYFEFYEMGGIQAVRFGDYKAIRTPFFTGPVELYNVTEDPHEDNNLAEQQPELVAKAAAFMDASHVPDPRWQASKGAAGRD